MQCPNKNVDMLTSPYGRLSSIIAVCIYHLVMISINLSKTTAKKCSGNPRQNSVPDKFSLRKKLKIFFSNTMFFSNNFFSQTEFCLRLHTAIVVHMQSYLIYLCGFMIHKLAVFTRIWSIGAYWSIGSPRDVTNMPRDVKRPKILANQYTELDRDRCKIYNGIKLFRSTNTHYIQNWVFALKLLV